MTYIYEREIVMKNTTTRPGFWLRAIEYRKHELAREQRHAFRETLADKARVDISDEDYATTMATLEKMARNLGWRAGAESEGHFWPSPRRQRRGPSRAADFRHDHDGRRHGHGPGPFGRGFGHFDGSEDLPTPKPEA